ncbi:MerR family transcriptional regulator [Calidifontibacter indicus]|uniref:MerR family transcriptional regulator n=1 Tax=Calidifontibacter indicus TaxID=419650 RepID=UPI003D7131E9
MTTPPERTWTIAELADEFGVTHRSLRHYEDLGMLGPERVGSARVYHRSDRIRLQLILRGRRLGMSLPQIRTIVAMYDQPPGEIGQLEYLLGELADRRADLEQRRRDLEQSLAELDEIEARCRADLDRLRRP